MMTTARVVANYHYVDEAGTLLYVVERREPKDFRQKKPTGNGEWDYKLNGVRRVPYRLPELIAADVTEWVFVVEGEKDADRLASLGLTATTNAQGAENWHTVDPGTIDRAFRDRPVVIVPDNDDAGRRRIDQVGASVEPAAASVQVLKLPGLPDKGDVSDWLDAGGTVEELRKLAAAAPAWQAPWDVAHDPPKDTKGEPPPKWPAPVYASELSAAVADIDWKWFGCLAGGHITLLSALMKAGKTTAFVHLLKALQSGTAFLDRKTSKCRTLVVSEESQTLWRQRRDAFGLDDSVSFLCKPIMVKPSLAEWVEFITYIGMQAAERNCDVVAFDTIGAFVPWKNENDAAEVTAALLPLNYITEAGRAVLLNGHAGKNDQGEGKNTRGSTALPGAVDIILELRRYTPTDLKDRRRVLTGLGRFDDVPDEVVVCLSEDGTEYTAEGDRKAIKARELEAAILELLPAGLPGLKGDEIHEQMPKDERPGRTTVGKALVAGLEKGLWKATGTGGNRDPRKFYVERQGS